MPIRRRGLTQAERAEWAAFARTVTPLPDRDIPEAANPTDEPAGTPPVAHQPVEASAPNRRVPASALQVGTAPGGLDAGSWNRLRTGKLTPARTLDLHGHTVHRAYVALHAFLHAAHGDRLRCVEIITGKGSGESGGAIRRELPLWLNTPTVRPLVLAATYRHAANQGSVLLLLRRTRV